MRFITMTPLLLAAMFSASLAPATADGAVQAPPAKSADGKRELVLAGCLLRSGYAGYQLDEAKLEAIDGKQIPEAAMTSAQIGVPKKWALEGGGNLGPRVGERVQIVGRSDWQEASVSKQSPEEPPGKGPVLEVKSVKTLQSSCAG